MAQIIPPITTLPEGTTTAPSVEDIQDRLPSICVDYLSHNWTEEDVWASWRNMTRHKHEIANGVRLENASWRTWNKQRNKLRTISPETLNWLKDSDVTWLYGPLHTAAVEPVRPLKVSTVDERLGIDHPTGMKPSILKRRTLSELLSLPNQSPVLEPVDCDDDGADTPPSAGGRPSIVHTRSETSLGRSNSLPVRRRPREDTLVSAMNRNAQDTVESKEPSPDRHPGPPKRHISFNTFVEQVIALDEPLVSPKPTFEEDSDDEMLEIRSHRSNRTSSMSSYASTSASMTIAKIPPAMLKTAGSFTNNPHLPRMVYQPSAEYLSPQVEVPPAATSPFGLPSPIGGPGAAARWKTVSSDEEGYSGIGMDYFGGPDLTGSSPNANAAAANLAPQFVRSPPSVQQPPVQPKWRQQAQPVDVAPGTSPSPSSSTSSLNNNILSPQPGRSILKVRSSASSVPVPEPVSPPAIFNYNPSVATGIGGMYGSYEEAKLVLGSPNKNEDQRGREHRGRSTSRGYGSSQNDRAAGVTINARASSTSSSSSMSRSPQEAPGGKFMRGRDPQSDKTIGGAPTIPDVGAVAGQDAMDVDYLPERSSTPTPHSSPQIVLRPLKDTSPASLPHNSSTRAPGLKPEFPSTPTTPTTKNASTGTSGASGPFSQSPATVAHENAEPTLSQPADTPTVDDDDGSTLIGRATNIANTAKDLLGALWYGQQDVDGHASSSPGAATVSRHRRGGSLG